MNRQAMMQRRFHRWLGVPKSHKGIVMSFCKGEMSDKR